MLPRLQLNLVRLKTAAPSTPVSITGLNEAPMAGDHFAVYEDEKE